MLCWFDQHSCSQRREVKREQKARSLLATPEPALSGNERQVTRQRSNPSRTESAPAPGVTSRELRALVRGQSGFANLDVPLLESTGTKKRRQIVFAGPFSVCVH